MCGAPVDHGAQSHNAALDAVTVFADELAERGANHKERSNPTVGLGLSPPDQDSSSTTTYNDSGRP